MKTLTLTRGLSNDGKTLYITDATETYGTDLPARDTLALLPYFTYIPKDKPVETVAPLTYSPGDVVTFGVDVSARDGVYYSIVYAIPEWSAGPLEEGDIVYDTNDNKLKKVISSVLTEITVASLADEDVDFGEIKSKIDVQLTKYLNELELIKLEKLEAYMDHICEEYEYLMAKRDFDYVNSQLGGAHIAFCQGSPTIAQSRIEAGIAFAEKALKIDEA